MPSLFDGKSLFLAAAAVLIPTNIGVSAKKFTIII